MKPLFFALWVVLAFGGLSAQQTGWQPSPGHTQVPIWPGTVPDAQPSAGPEVAKTTSCARRSSELIKLCLVSKVKNFASSAEPEIS